ncbi:hypothetical protein MIR68_004579 [Amoeboaphelidium protococcarum]|nr:hypothetical protein MIR68_004579 [Amoeboaphelidium protococcarum]
MGKKQKRQQAKQWCWYCDREFDDEKVLIDHQKAKHFKCSICNKRLHSTQGMVRHLEQVHKEVIDRVPNAMEGRDSLDVQVIGMDGIPPQDLALYHRRYSESASSNSQSQHQMYQTYQQQQQQQQQQFQPDYSIGAAYSVGSYVVDPYANAYADYSMYHHHHHQQQHQLQQLQPALQQQQQAHILGGQQHSSFQSTQGTSINEINGAQQSLYAYDPNVYTQHQVASSAEGSLVSPQYFAPPTLQSPVYTDIHTQQQQSVSLSKHVGSGIQQPSTVSVDQKSVASLYQSDALQTSVQEFKPATKPADSLQQVMYYINDQDLSVEELKSLSNKYRRFRKASTISKN